MTGRQTSKRLVIDRIRRGNSNLGRRYRPEGGGADASLEAGSLAEQRPRSNLGDGMSVNLDVEDAVEQQVEVRPRRCLVSSVPRLW